MKGDGFPAGMPPTADGRGASVRAAGLPFAGIPPEVAERVRAIEAAEPAHPEPVVRFDPSTFERVRLTLWTLLRGHRADLAWTFLLVVVVALSSHAGPRLLAWAIDHGVLARRPSVLAMAFVAYLGTVAASIVTNGMRIRRTSRLGQQLLYELRLRVFTHMQRLSLDFYTKERAGRLMSRMTSDIDSLSALLQDGLVDLAVHGLTLILICAVLFSMNVKLTVVMLVVVVPAMLGITWWFRAASDRGYPIVRDRIADVLADLSESLSGIRLLNSFNRRCDRVNHHRNVVAAYTDANVRMAALSAAYTPASELFGLAGQIAVLWLGSRMVANGSLSMGSLAAFLLYLAAFFAPIQALVQLHGIFQSGRAAMTKLAELLATEPGVLERHGARELPHIEGRIELTDVRFGYDPQKPVVDGLTLTVERGETVALMGATGAGKSTIAKLIARFYDVQSGSVKIDGHDVRELTLRSLRSQLGVVPQEPFLFHGSIRDNVAFDRPDVTESDIRAACHAVGLGELLARLPEGLDQPCFDRGATLSAGERQLITLARVLLAKPRVLLLDEATSNLDMQSEALFERALERTLEGRTAVLIAHRCSTARRAGRIAVVEHGRVVEIGCHDELLAMGGHYATIWQASEGRE